VAGSVKKTDLRRAGRQALVEEGYEVTALSGPGVLPGARLEAVRGKEVLTVAVRATQERFVGFSRHPNGHWRTLENVDLVLVATPIKKSLRAVEALAFNASELIPLFNDAQKQTNDAEPINSLPVFIPLDSDNRKQLGHTVAGLKEHAVWRRVIESKPKSDEPTSKMDAFLERVRREFAELTGVTVENVSVEFKVKS
jgi:hypothetical protein